MTIRRPPRAPWYSPATRRLGLVRVGLPTLVACLVAVAPGAAADAQRVVPPGAAALVADATQAAHNVFDPPLGGRGRGGRGDGSRGAR
jgi:hypothetical protein